MSRRPLFCVKFKLNANLSKNENATGDATYAGAVCAPRSESPACVRFPFNWTRATKSLLRKSTDPLGSGVWEFSLPPSYNPPSTAGRNSERPALAPFLRQKFWVAPLCARNFKRLKNREDKSDFDDFRTKLIAPTQTFISKIFVSTKFVG